MKQKISLYFLLAALVYTLPGKTQTWVDTLNSYAREAYLPANHYHWTWIDAALLNTMVKEYDQCPADKKQQYLDYVKTAMDKTLKVANGKTPNAIASGLGLAFLYRVTKDEKYKAKADKIYRDYLKIKRTKEGAVSHLMLVTELWDDTIFMIGEYLLGMYQATGDEKYIDELVKQIRLHRDKLLVNEYGLWVHGYDKAGWGHCMFCSQPGWAKNPAKRSAEMWGRGNGWIIVTLSDALETLPQSHPHRNELTGYLKEMIARLPELQDTKTGHWYQLPVRKEDPQNFIESSCTAMFAFGITTALKLGIVSSDAYKKSIALAYNGLRQYSLTPVADKYLITQNVCMATCIGSKNYYLKRPVQKGKPYAIGMFIRFGDKYERYIGIRKGY